MKKVIFSFALLLTSVSLFAQRETPAVIEVAAEVTDGQNTIRIPEERARIQFTKRGDRIFNVVLSTDDGGVLRLEQSEDEGGICFSNPENQESAVCFYEITNIPGDSSTLIKGKVIKRAILTCRKAGGTQQEY